jgi:hypothetical protein
VSSAGTDPQPTAAVRLDDGLFPTVLSTELRRLGLHLFNQRTEACVPPHGGELVGPPIEKNIGIQIRYLDLFSASAIADKPNGKTTRLSILASSFNALWSIAFSARGIGFTSDSVLPLHFDNNLWGAASQNIKVFA